MGRALSVVLASGVALALPSRASAETRFSLDYATVGACPDRAGFLDQVAQRTHQARLTDPGQAELQFTVRAESTGEVHRGILDIRAGTGDSRRELSGESCVEVVSALALVVALTVDPLASTAPVPPPAVLVPITVPPAPLPLPAPLPPLVRRPPRSSHDASVPPPFPLPVLVLREDSTVSFGFGAHFVIDVGPAPNPLLGGAGFVQVRSIASPRYALRAEIGYQASPTADIPRDTLVMSLLRGRFEACALGVLPARWLLLWPCADLGGGGLFATRARGATNLTADATAPWVGAGLGGRGDLLVHENVSVEVRAGATGALLRGVFRDANGSVLFAPFPVGFSGGLGLAAAF